MTLKHYGYMRSLLQTHASLNTGGKLAAESGINLNQALPQTAGKIKIGLPDFSISFLWKR